MKCRAAVLCEGFLFLTVTASSSWQQWYNSIGQRRCSLSFAADISKGITKIFHKPNAWDGRVKEEVYTLVCRQSLSFCDCTERIQIKNFHNTSRNIPSRSSTHHNWNTRGTGSRGRRSCIHYYTRPHAIKLVVAKSRKNEVKGSRTIKCAHLYPSL